jgi:hypothetical protein
MFKNMNNREVLKATILKKLKRRGKWSGAHTSFDVLARGIPKHLRGAAKEVAMELIKDGLLLSKPTSYGLEVSLNPERKEEIDKIILKHLSE